MADVEMTMNQQLAFDDALDAAEQLDADAQAELVAVLTRRLAERGRQRIADTVAQARQEFDAGQCRPMTAAELLREARP
jgi:ribosomal protein S4